MHSRITYRLTWVSLTSDMEYLFMAAPAKHSHCSLPWTRGILSQPSLLTLVSNSEKSHNVNHLNTRHHPITNSTLSSLPHVNNKQAKIQSQSSADRITISLSLVPRGKTSKQKLSRKTPYMKLAQTTGPNLGGHKPKGRNNSTFKHWVRRPQTQQVKEK